ncbi:receptor-like protein 9DC3 [Ipomoea triloba]|uniref:receptor-like protein 9DC3 n=1 Tax=Ipomoea triloba TaxID=35885 RepID=UPI00125E3668|nr:receptor-like protein 9DC3 [Ipomoea triloba]
MRIVMFIWISILVLSSNLFRINVTHALGQKCLSDQKSVLLQIRSQLSYDSSFSHKLALWEERVDCCEWPGVSCNDAGYISGLDLMFEPIIGGFDMSLMLKLTFLSVIRFDRVNFSAPFPDFFQDFRNLTVLSLMGCNFSGTVPQKVFQVPTLQIIDLSFNKMLGGSLPHFPENGCLQSLDLGYTKFSGKLPESIGNLKLLSFIDLSHCDFSGAIPASIAKLTKLVVLSVDVNHFSSWIPSFRLFKNLTCLDLSHNDFTGEVPSSHWDGLDNLENLYLDKNSFSGPIPASLFFLPSLRILSLSENKFSGQILDFQNVTSPLKVLDLGDNNLEGPIPSFFFQLHNLTSLDLSSNKLSGQIIDLQNVTSPLDFFDLSSNNLEGTIPSFFFELQRLTSLYLSSNKFSGQIIDLQNAVTSQLQYLDLSNNNLEGTIPSFFFQFQNLISLHLSSNKFNGTVYLTKFRNPRNLESLDFSHNSLVVDINIGAEELAFLPQFSDLMLASCNLQKFPTFLKNQSSLVLLDLSSNNLSSMPLDIGDQLPNVIFFSIANNRVSGRISPSWCHATSLQVLDLSNNTLYGTVQPCLVQNNSILSVLNLKGNHLSGEIPQMFPDNCSLETLDLSQNHLHDKIPTSLVNCTKLKVLNLGSNRMNDAFPCWLNKLLSLHVLVLHSNHFHGNISCPRLGVNNSWPSLQVIDISNNKFSGIIPADLFLELKAIAVESNATQSKPDYFYFTSSWRKYYQYSVSLDVKGNEYSLEKILTLFTSIDFSCNQFQGGIPEIIGELTQLYLLNISHNALTSNIPPSLENLKALEALDLSFNNLAGNIPEQLESLNFLSFLNLSYNHLVGRIPQGKQFNTFDASSFMGNKGLCGFQLNVSCSGIIKPTSPPPKLEEQESAYDGDIYVSVALGFVVGVGGIFVPLLVSHKWSLYYNKKIDEVLLKVFFQRDSGRRKKHG